MDLLENKRLIDITVAELVTYLDNRYTEKQMNTTKPLFIKSKECAMLTGYKEEYIRQLVFKKKIPFHKANNGSLRFLESEIIAWMQANKRLPNDVLAQAFMDNNPLNIKSNFLNR